jgi:S-layer protein
VDVSGTLESTAKSTSTAGNDTFNAILGTGATLNSFDNINGGSGGTDTLNIASDVAGAQTFPASTTIAGFETVNLSRTGAGTNTLTVTNTTFGTGVQNFSVTDAGNAIAGAYGITLASARSVSVVGTATALGAITVTDTDATTTATQGSLLNTVTGTKAASLAVNGNGVTTVNINAIAGTTTITSAAGTRALAINASGTTTQGALTDAEATSAVVTVSGAQTLGLVTVAKATSVTINTNAAATTSIAAAVATTLNLGGTNLNTLTINAATVAATSVVITGAGGVAADLTPITALTSVNTTGSTAAVPASGVLTGANTLTIGAGVTFTGGAGQEIITVAQTSKVVNLGAGNDTAILGTTALSTGGSVNGGDGTADILKLSNANAVTLGTAGAVQTAFRAAVTGFETLDITAQTASTVAVGGAGTFTKVQFTSADAAQIFTGITSGYTIESIWAVDAATAGSGVAINTLTGGADVLNVRLSGDLSGGARVFGDTWTLTGIETVNLAMVDTNATFTARAATITIADAQLQNLVISGNNGVTVTHTGTALLNFDASALTKGVVSFTSGVLTTDATVKGSVTGGDTLNFAAAVAKVTMTATAGANSLTGSATIASTITGGSGNDTIVGGAAADSLVGGAGNDTITNRTAGTATAADTISGGAGNDTFVLLGSVASATAYTGAANVSDFAVTNDIVGLSATLTNYVAGAGTIQAGVAAAAAGATGVQTVAQNAAGAAYTAGGDLIKLTTGVAFTTSVQATFNAAIGTASVTGLGAGRDIFASYYDTTNSKAVFVSVNSTAGTNTIFETGDVVTLIGTVDMTSADYALFNNNNLQIVA